jgi:hypothetical protein
MALASSTVITPSRPTFSMASARSSPMVASPLALMVPIWAISSRRWVAFDCSLRPSVTCATPASMPRLSSMGLCPAATRRAPSLYMDWASTVAVVVPSPATSEVLAATSFTICAPTLASLSESSISLATVTPSLVTVGEPHALSMTTFRPRGPRVTFTASASTFMPWAMPSRAFCASTICLAAMVESSLLCG